MSTKISLRLESKIDLEFLSQNIHMRLIRLWGTAQLKTPKGWSPEEDIIIDTGSPVSVLPYSIWSQTDAKLLLPSGTRIFGLGSDDNKGLSGKFGEIYLALKDKKRVSPIIKVKAHLLDNDSAPFILGFEDVLTEAKLVCDYKRKTAYLEFENKKSKLK